MNLQKLLKNISKPMSIPNMIINKITTNSKSVDENDLFIAIKGYSFNGHDFINQAIKAGAVCIIGEEDLQELSVPYIRVPDSRLALAEIASEFYGNPAKDKKIIGITGTNGKTTTAYMIKHILEESGHTCAMFGSVNTIINGETYPSLNTTPDALSLQKHLAISKDEFVIMEVSSHGIAQGRIHGIEFDFGLFTNLDHDHLDYHHTMEDYFLTKAKMFEALNDQGYAIINNYNEWGAKLSSMLQSRDLSLITLGNKESDKLRINEITPGFFEISYRGCNHSLQLSILGQHNISNAAMAFLTASQIGVPIQQIVKSLRTFSGVPGRFELFKRSNGTTIVVDYAHTAEAFSNCLTTAKIEGAEKVFHVFGFRGDRDSSKRNKMITVSKKLADEIILTFDDLNGVPSAAMLQELNELNEGQVISDRTLAIQYAIEKAAEKDWVIITGKGNERYRADFSLPVSSDREAVEYVLQKEGKKLKTR
ncbi:UDP-N-acetylmuramoyl-L-alanyl-D-glutamate--2,6-diaminopimelate ligase [Oceanobacillus oncorhynchi subsp. incaldanensis]|uniref:UDP-N-acetylmuramoyl-L-alanyl-D-glutamate--2, 6-diaminopimelate ligase n=1 Tax=Oceanobacillus oncorhynchi TaxID=545501 RepID=UPI001B19DA0A|nr:UDP-N-acetylmuramoyl-L-alanyl-D-glutamate--2,6-diaminopimelate ligase [Oceanobacillus oncorhynchi]GIO17417.1 UDP-N-acetylmuramoyl-L-alanyl-D-glutamate--2,6-diaminopimelate ligase [Oceanobacillus oncorhynchi subsp. incaldanensis]